MTEFMQSQEPVVAPMPDGYPVKVTEAMLLGYYDIAVRALSTAIGSREDHADAAQDLAVKMWEGRGRFSDPLPNMTPYVTTAARNTLISNHRKNGRSVPSEWVSDAEAHPALTTPGPSELGVVVDAAMAQLLPIHREVLDLFYREDLTHSQIADELGISIGTVKSRISRAQDKLRAIVGDVWGLEEVSG